MSTLHHPVYIIDDDDGLRESMEDLLRSAGYAVRTFASATAFLELRGGFLPSPSCLVLDINMPHLDGFELQSKLREDGSNIPIIFLTGHADIPGTVRAIKAGAIEFFTKPFDAASLLEAVARAAQLSTRRTFGEDENDGYDLGMIGRSPSLRRVLRETEIVARTDATALITGETGTGKELVARAIHARSGRSGAFVKVNCAAVPGNLLESELMGHEKGAFTGAFSRRIGRFERAQDGTIFLDEIGEMPLELQPKVLRLLQEREFERIGSNQTIRSNARLIAATNRDLRAMTAERTFREDLYYRVNVFPIELPPLRERREDIPILAQRFADDFAARSRRHIGPIPPEVIDLLCAHDWPGNIRELLNVIERAAILAVDGVFSPSALLFATSSRPVRESDPPPRSARTDGDPRGAAHTELLEELSRRHILAVLNSANWRLGGPGGAAARLGLKRSTLIYRMKKLGIERGLQGA